MVFALATLAVAGTLLLPIESNDRIRGVHVAVPDAPTAELMTEFYNQLAQGQTKAQALRQAMLITMQTHPDPKNWAAFTLIGNAE